MPPLRNGDIQFGEVLLFTTHPFERPANSLAGGYETACRRQLCECSTRLRPFGCLPLVRPVDRSRRSQSTQRSRS